jgi:hypothetical protein
VCHCQIATAVFRAAFVLAYFLLCAAVTLYQAQPPNVESQDAWPAGASPACAQASGFLSQKTTKTTFVFFIFFVGSIAITI